MPIKLGRHEDGHRMQISDSGRLQRCVGGKWFSCDPADLCKGVGVRGTESRGLNGEEILSHRLLLKSGRSIVVRRIGCNGSSYYDVDRLQTRLERDLDNDRHCIR